MKQNELYSFFDDLDLDSIDSILESYELDAPIDKTIKKNISRSVMKKINLSENVKKNKLSINNLFSPYVLLKNKFLVCSVLFGFFSINILTNIPMYYVCLDINPSVELGVNLFNKVIKYSYYNKQGEDLLSKNKIKNECLATSVDTLLTQAVSDGYQANNSLEASIAIYSKVDDYSDNLEKTLENVVSDVSKNTNLDVNLYQVSVDSKEVQESKSLDMSYGKLELIEKLQALDSTIKIDDYKDKSINEIMNKYNELIKIVDNPTSNDINVISSSKCDDKVSSNSVQSSDTDNNYLSLSSNTNASSASMANNTTSNKNSEDKTTREESSNTNNIKPTSQNINIASTTGNTDNVNDDNKHHSSNNTSSNKDHNNTNLVSDDNKQNNKDDNKNNKKDKDKNKDKDDRKDKDKDKKDKDKHSNDKKDKNNKNNKDKNNKDKNKNKNKHHDSDDDGDEEDEDDD